MTPPAPFRLGADGLLWVAALALGAASLGLAGRAVLLSGPTGGQGDVEILQAWLVAANAGAIGGFACGRALLRGTRYAWLGVAGAAFAGALTGAVLCARLAEPTASAVSPVLCLQPETGAMCANCAVHLGDWTLPCLP